MFVTVYFSLAFGDCITKLSASLFNTRGDFWLNIDRSEDDNL